MRTIALALLFLSAGAGAWAQEVTFTKDVAPIIFGACVSCHRDGGPGPFNLTTYDEVRRRATQVAQVTRSRFMPPWKIEPGVGHFVGQRTLSDAEIDRYVSREPSFGCAGGFKAEGLGITLFDRMESADPTAIVGLPLIWLAGALRAAGFSLP